MLITKEQYIELKDCAREEDGIKVTSTYSGRGMYGESCLGIFGDYIDTWDVYLFIRSILGQDMAEEMMNSRSQDSLGMGRIIYFSDVKVDISFEEEAEYDDEYGDW